MILHTLAGEQLELSLLADSRESCLGSRRFSTTCVEPLNKFNSRLELQKRLSFPQAIDHLSLLFKLDLRVTICS